MQFKDVLKSMREEKNLSQKTLAEASGVSPTCICQLETGMRNPTGSTLVALADFFEVSVDYLLGRADDFGNITVKSTADNNITKEEQEILQSFRSLSRSEQTQLKEYATFLSKKKK